MPSELDSTTEINSTYTDDIPGTGTVVVRAEEALIVVLVLVLWVAAIALFFNRWGKIRMLEPYQPKFQQQHRQSCAEQNPVQHRSYSKFNIHCIEHPSGYQTSCVSGLSRPRQNSVFVGSSASLLACQDTPRRAKSAFDLQSLVLAECTVSPRDTKDEQINESSLKTLKPMEPSRTRDRRTSVCQFDGIDVLTRTSLQQDHTSFYQFDRTDVLARPMQRDRGMSICQFDRMDVLARPLQRDRGMSICHFDRTDVLARPFQRDRGNSICQFDRMDVLARPMYVSRTRERRVSVCNFLEKDEEAGGRGLHRADRRLSFGNTEKAERAKERTLSVEKQENSKVKEKNSGSVTAIYHYDRPSCSKTPDVVLGYKATCV